MSILNTKFEPQETTDFRIQNSAKILPYEGATQKESQIRKSWLKIWLVFRFVFRFSNLWFCTSIIYFGFVF